MLEIGPAGTGAIEPADIPNARSDGAWTQKVEGISGAEYRSGCRIHQYQCTGAGMEDQTSSTSDEQSGSSETNPGDTYNQRIHPRREWKSPVQVAWLADHVEDCRINTLRASDISAGGMALISRSMVHPGQQGIVLLGKGKCDPIVRGLEVCHCRYDVRLGQHVIGCSWIVIPPQISAFARRTQTGYKLAIESVTVPTPRDRNDLSKQSGHTGEPESNSSAA